MSEFSELLARMYANARKSEFNSPGGAHAVGKNRQTGASVGEQTLGPTPGETFDQSLGNRLGRMAMDYYFPNNTVQGSYQMGEGGMGTYSNPEFGSFNGQGTGAEYQTGAGGEGGGGGMGNAGAVLAIIRAVSAMREAFGDTKPKTKMVNDEYGNPYRETTEAPPKYKDKAPAEKIFSAPGTVLATPGLNVSDSYFYKAILGDDNPLSKASDWLGQGEEDIVGKPLAKAFQGDIGGAIEQFLYGVEDLFS